MYVLNFINLSVSKRIQNNKSNKKYSKMKLFYCYRQMLYLIWSEEEDHVIEALELILAKIKGSEFTTESHGCALRTVCFTVRTESAGYGKHRCFPGDGSGVSYTNVNSECKRAAHVHVHFVRTHRSACHLSGCGTRQMCTLGNCRLNSTVGRLRLYRQWERQFKSLDHFYNY